MALIAPKCSAITRRQENGFCAISMEHTWSECRSETPAALAIWPMDGRCGPPTSLAPASPKYCFTIRATETGGLAQWLTVNWHGSSLIIPPALVTYGTGGHFM